MISPNEVLLTPAIRRLNPESRFEKLKEICKKHNVRYYADKGPKGHFKFKPLWTTENLCGQLAKYCDYYVEYSGQIGNGYRPQTKNGRPIYSYEAVNASGKPGWVIANFYIRKPANP